MAVVVLASSRFSCGQDASLLEVRQKEEERLALKIRSLVPMESIQTAAVVVVVGIAASVDAEGDCDHVVGGATAAAPTGVDGDAPSAVAFVSAVAAAAPFAIAAAAPYAIAYAVASVIAVVVAESEMARRASCLHG